MYFFHYCMKTHLLLYSIFSFLSRHNPWKKIRVFKKRKVNVWPLIGASWHKDVVEWHGLTHSSTSLVLLKTTNDNWMVASNVTKRDTRDLLQHPSCWLFVLKKTWSVQKLLWFVSLVQQQDSIANLKRFQKLFAEPFRYRQPHGRDRSNKSFNKVWESRTLGHHRLIWVELLRCLAFRLLFLDQVGELVISTNQYCNRLVNYSRLDNSKVLCFDSAQNRAAYYHLFAWTVNASGSHDVITKQKQYFGQNIVNCLFAEKVKCEIK